MNSPESCTSRFRERVLKRAEKLREVEGACGICHGVAEAVTDERGTICAYERPSGVLAVIRDDGGEEVGRGLDIVWSSAVLAAQLDAGLIPARLKDKLAEVLSDEEEIKAVADLYGYGRVVTPSVLALQYVKEAGGRTLIRRRGVGVVALLLDREGKAIAESPVSYCPTCAIVRAAAGNSEVSAYLKERLKNVRNTGKAKFEEGVENRYEVRGGAVRTSIIKDGRVLADRVLGCCIAYSTTKAEVAAGFASKESAERFKAYCNLCPLKHCWMEKSMGAMGNIVLHRLSEIGAEVEVTAEGLIIARIPGEGIIGRGTLCSLSALTNMLITADGNKLLKPSPAKRFP
ncbi:MAG: hypothetical protein QFX33_00790 [Candidatus Nezhaarchaeota archaeon]|nr:hypothetical protein [Candidatus Nezhaarchaeota archaeon]